MHKLQKFQGGGITNFDPYKSYSEKTKNRFSLGDSSLFSGNKKKNVFGELGSQWELPKMKNTLDFSAQTAAGATLPQQAADAGISALGSTDSTGSGAVKGGLFSGKQGAMNISGLIGKGFDFASSFVKPLDHVSGAAEVGNVVGDVLGQIPTPLTMGASALIKGVLFADKALGKSANKLGTQGATGTGYQMGTNANAGTSYGGIFGNKARKQQNTLTAGIDLQNIKKLQASRAGEKDLLAASNSTADTINRNYDTLKGSKSTNILAAHEGIKLLIKKAHLLKSGGNVNVIPSGALHRELNHLEGDHTKKGIPVILDKGGEVEQQAEIEREEIIFNLDLTKQLEDLHKKFEKGDENAAIEAGKLLTYEILENTVDNTNLLNTIQ